MRGAIAMTICFVILAFAGCSGGGDGTAEGVTAATEPVLGEPLQVVPGDGLPAEVSLLNANNNLDVVRHEGRVYLAFRTAPLHFASRRTVMYVVSSEDQRTWTYETEIAMSTDLREPRFLSWKGRLWLFFAVLGPNPSAFEPGHARVMERLGDGDWTTPTPFYEDGFIPWRLVPYAGRIWMIGYTGGENIYDMEADPVRIHWLASEDGESWSPAVGGEAVVLEGGGSETGFSFTEDGAVVAVVRNENGDADGWGSKVCRAEANALDDWRCESDPRKYDSPLLFNHAGIFWLVGRRNVTETGNYDLGGDDRTHAQRSFNNQTTYWLEPKRCSLWRVDPESLTVHFETDLPSRGDTCFASVIEADPDADHDYDLYNYTSPLDGEDVGWQDGQNGPTLIYRLALTLPTQ